MLILFRETGKYASVILDNGSIDSDVRRRLRRRTEMVFFSNISETIRASNFKIDHKVENDSLYISTGNDLINYFRTEAIRTNV